MFLLCVTYTLGLWRSVKFSCVGHSRSFTTSGRVEPQRLKVHGEESKTGQHSRSHQLSEILVYVCLRATKKPVSRLLISHSRRHTQGTKSHTSSEYGRWQRHGSAGFTFSFSLSYQFIHGPSPFIFLSFLFSSVKLPHL